MSVKLMSLVWDTGLQSTHKIILLAMADFSNDEGRSIYPSNATLCKKTSLRERAVRNGLRALEEIGVIKQIGFSEFQTTEYAIDVEALKALEQGGIKCRGGHDVPGRGALNAGEGGIKCRGGGHDVPGRGALNAPNTLVKPLVNPPVNPPADSEPRRGIFQSPEVEIYEEITGLPPDAGRVDRIKALVGAVRKTRPWPREKLVGYLKEYYDLWCSSRTSDGRPYNRTRPDWLEWAATGYKPVKGGSNDDGKQNFYDQLNF